MEDILAKIMKDASSSKHGNIKKSCLESQELLANQDNLMRSAIHELRAKMLETLQLTLESKHSRLVSHALNGFQRMLWDKTFQSVFEVGNDENWLPIQLLKAIESFNSQPDDVLLEILKILLNMSTIHAGSFTSRSIIMMISVCYEAYINHGSGVRTAAQVAINQTLSTFCLYLQETDAGVEDQTDDSDEENEFNLAESLVEELYPILNFITEKLKDVSQNRIKCESSFLLECILTMLHNIKTDVFESPKFINFIWQELSPLLVILLGSPKTDKNIISSHHNSEMNEIGRGSGCLATAPSFQSVVAKTIYSIFIELVRLTGSVGSLRPVLESLFHRMLLYPPVQHRLEALKAVKELFSNPELLLQLAAPPLHATSDKDWISLDLDLIKIAIDCLGECSHSSNKNICYASVSCTLALLKTLEEISCGKSLKEELIICINSQFRTLESSDYKGAKSERWLKNKLRSLIIDKEKKGLLREKLKKEGARAALEYTNAVKTVTEKINNESSSSDPDKSLPESKEVEKEFIGFNEDKASDLDLKEVDFISDESNSESNEIDKTEFKIEEKNTDYIVEEPISADDDHSADFIESDSEVKETDENVDMLDAKQKTSITEDFFVEEKHVSDVCEEFHIALDDCVQENIADKLQSDEESDEHHNGEPNLHLEITSLNPPTQLQEITSPVTESAEEALNYVTSSSSEGSNLSEDLDKDFDNAMEDFTDDEERLKKIPRTLLGHEDAGKEERERIEKLCLARLEFAQQERQNAQNFVSVLRLFLPELLAIRSSIEADQALQEFSSKYCEDLWQSQQSIKDTESKLTSHITILNADGIYLALYSALLLNLKLIRNNYYKNLSGDIPLSEQQFIEEVHGSGVLVYLSATWLAELYQQILAKNLLEEGGYKPGSLENFALINLLSDVDGLGNSLPGSQQLSDFRRLEKAVINNQSSPHVEAGRKFSRRILTCCWETVMEVSSVLLNGTNSCGISSTVGFLLGTEGAKEEHRRTKDAIAESLDGLQRAARLCNELGLQSCCSAVFAQLATASCPLSDDSLFPKISSKFENKHFKKSLLSGRSKALRLHASHILSMDVILNKGLELGSHSPDCWKYVFQCCLFVLQLENMYFSGHRNTQSIISRPVLHTQNQSSFSESQLLSMDSNSYDYLSMPGSTVPPKLEIKEIIKETHNFANTSDVIKDHQLLEAIEVLSQLVDRLFEEAAGRLNLHALITFLVELCAASQTQLFTQNYTRISCSNTHGTNLLLYHLGDVMLRCARGGRPLIHVMKAWSVVAPHFVEAACHKDSLISKKGVSTIHDIVSALLSSNSELPHFHFNEALFKPFENLLCLELCDVDVQEQIVSSICEFVEGCTAEIRSGWRPLFGALRTVQLPSISGYSETNLEREHLHHLRVVLDVFEAFLSTDNVFVFAYAAVDCLLCLLKHVKGPTELQDISDVICDSMDKPSVPLDMCLAALKYLEKCSDILSTMYKIPTCPVFNSAHRIQGYSVPDLVDPVIPGIQIVYFEDPDSVSNDSGKVSSSLKNEDIEEIRDINNISRIDDVSVSLQSLEKHTGIIHVWFLLLEGLAGTLATCPKQYQSATMETLFNMLRNLKDVPGPEFGIYCVNHLLLPMLQRWLRRTTKIYRGWDNFATNFKQCCGLASDLIVDYIQHISDTVPSKLSKGLGINLMLEQLFLVLIECVAQPMEIISRLGCSCIRHTVMTAGKYFTDEMWDIVCHNLKRVCRVSLYCVKQLMVCFHVESDNFYGDIGEVKVAARRDCTVQESERLRQLSHQVFLLDCQQIGSLILKSTCVEDDERSFTFLLFPPNYGPNDPDSSVIRVPFRSLVVSLLSHQILLQTLGSLLLQGTKYMLPTLVSLLPSESSLSSSVNEAKKPGFLSKLSNKQLCILFKCLEESYKTACDFDMRPGLKFLVQKVAQTNVAANLYKQAGVSWTIQMVAIFEICMSSADLCLSFVKNKLLSIINNSTESLNKSNEEEKTSNGQLTENCNDVNINEFLMLSEKFKDICETYTEHTDDKEGFSTIADRMSDQPIFFLATPADDMNDILFPAKQSESHSSHIESSTEVPSQSGYDSSDSEDMLNHRNGESKDKIYTLATENTIHSLISEYKKRKNHHSMPSKQNEKVSRKLSSGSKRKSSDDLVPEEIVMQRRNSIMKDGEAQLQVFKQLIQSFLKLHQSLPDEHFKAYLPVFFPGVQFLVAYTTDAELRFAISEWLQKLAFCCDFYVDFRTVN
ncbi:brefeldin A-inhibited guanine nucleotide-exchange protein 3 [Caerostris darwini]|uniref:Brefeldin A-inhibited guanine nucleotide-exchange protein 3 n=1 Tax=Caerostris darwini TaxID=1538125 RepID=A0AAV4PKK7_9ARAC|nr:brefeldin A-inhibited guanine nucleotide-exchange protein 3 [Caerostris darwini]